PELALLIPNVTPVRKSGVVRVLTRKTHPVVITSQTRFLIITVMFPRYPWHVPGLAPRLSAMPVSQVGSAKVMSRVGNQRRSLTIARGACAIALAFGAISLLTSCNYATLGGSGSVAPADIDVLDKVRSMDIMPRQTQPVAATQNNVGERGRAA